MATRPAAPICAPFSDGAEPMKFKGTDDVLELVALADVDAAVVVEVMPTEA